MESTKSRFIHEYDSAPEIVPALLCCEQMDALRFGCISGCTNCCTRKGYVYLTEEDLHRAGEVPGIEL